MATLNVIRTRALGEQMSIREIARRAGLARNAVKEVTQVGRELAEEVRRSVKA